MNTSWTLEKSLQLIELFKNKPELWQNHHPNRTTYIVLANRASAWAEIAETIGVSVTDAKAKMTNLQGTWRKEISKIRLNEAQGLPSESTWIPFKNLQFLEQRDPLVIAQFETDTTTEFKMEEGSCSTADKVINGEKRMGRQKKGARWSLTDSLQLIEQYKSKPVLWDKSHPRFNATKKRAEAWRDIAKKTGLTVIAATTRMNMLFATLRKEVTKFRQKATQGIVAESKWVFFKKFSFLNLHDTFPMGVEWDSKNVFKLIELFKNKGELWNNYNANRSNASKRIEAWKDIGKQMGISAHEARRKMTSLQGSMRKELSKMRQKEAQCIIPHSSWIYFKSLEFLDQRGQFALDGEDQSMIGIESMDSFENVYGTDSNERFHDQEQESHVDRNIQCHSETNGAISATTNNMSEHPLETAEQQNVHLDECTTFTTHLATKLRKFPEPQRSILMHELNGVMLEAEVKLYSNSGDVSYSFN